VASRYFGLDVVSVAVAFIVAMALAVLVLSSPVHPADPRLGCVLIGEDRRERKEHLVYCDLRFRFQSELTFSTSSLTLERKLAANPCFLRFLQFCCEIRRYVADTDPMM